MTAAVALAAIVAVAVASGIALARDWVTARREPQPDGWLQVPAGDGGTVEIPVRLSHTCRTPGITSCPIPELSRFVCVCGKPWLWVFTDAGYVWIPEDRRQGQP